MASETKQQTFLQHLDELRGRLIKALVAIIIGTGAASFFTDAIIGVMVKPVGHLVFTAPAEAFTARLMIMVMAGFILSLPVTVYQIWSFVAEGLEETERRVIRIVGPLSFVFFLTGVVFAIFVLIPISFRFLLGFGSEALKPMITVKNYISFIVTLILVSGFIFELPLVLGFLAKIGIATPAFLREKRRLAVVIILILSALLTPPDVITQLIMAGPLLILYEMGIWVTAWVQRRSDAK